MVKKMIRLKTNKNKIGLFASLSMMIGSVIGVGIFVKNISVFRETGNNPTLIIAAWVISAIITLLLALSFIEVTTTGSSKFGVSGYCDISLGKKLDAFLRSLNPTFITGLLVLYCLCMLVNYSYSWLIQTVRWDY